jgi:Flp pilus assembly protein TadD
MMGTWNGRLLVTLVIMVAYLWGHSRLAGMDDRLFVRSPAGLRALGFYLAADYASAGRAYATLLDGPAAAGPAARPAGSDGAVDQWLARALGQAREGEAGQSVRTMHRILSLDPPAIGSSSSVFDVMTLAGDLSRVPRRERPAPLLAAFHAHLRRLDPAHTTVARAYAEEAIAHGDLVPESYVTLSILHDDAGNAVEARAALAWGLALAPTHPSVLVWAAIHARRHGDVLSEHRFLRAAWAATARDPAVGVALERLLTKLGDWHELKRLTAERAAVGTGDAVRE